MIDFSASSVREPLSPQEPRQARVWVLLATYNGEHYLPEFLDSLTGLKGPDWSLVAYDDGSTDSSASVLADFHRKHPEWVSCIKTSAATKPLGPAGAFSRLAELTCDMVGKTDLVVFADQDDVWSPQKLELMVARYEALPEEVRRKPVLLHSDLKVVDDAGRTIADSLVKLQNTDPRLNRLRNLLAQNTVTGCAMMVNSALLRKASPIPKSAIMHDWWFGLVAAATGLILFMPEPLVSYRQHAGNAVGARRYGIAHAMRYLLRARKRGAATRIQLCSLVAQAKALTEHEAFLGVDNQSQQLLQEFANLSYRSLLSRLLWFCSSGIRRSGFLRNVLFLYDIVTIRHDL